MSQKNVTMEKDTIIGQLFNAMVIPDEVPIWRSVDKLLDFLTNEYIHQHEENHTIVPPSILNGPIFEPSKEELEAVGIALITQGHAHGVNSIRFGELQEDSVSVNGIQDYNVEDMEWDINPALNVASQEAIKCVLRKHKSVFATSLKEIKALNVEPYSIKVKSGVKPVKVAPRMLPLSANEWLKNYIAQLIELDMIEPCSGPWAAAVVLVPNDKEKQKPLRRFKPMKRIPKIKVSPNDEKPKAIWSIRLDQQGINLVEEEIPGTELSAMEELKYNNGATGRHVVEVTIIPPEAGKKDPYRLCLNYRPINLAVLDTGYPIPNINAMFTLLADAQYYSVFDCLKGFWQLELDEESRDFTGFASTFGQYRWKRLPMGLKVSPQAWQSYMDGIFFEELNQFVMIYIDDGLVFSKTFEDHLKHLDRVLTRAEESVAIYFQV